MQVLQLFVTPSYFKLFLFFLSKTFINHAHWSSRPCVSSISPLPVLYPKTIHYCKTASPWVIKFDIFFVCIHLLQGLQRTQIQKKFFFFFFSFFFAVRAKVWQIKKIIYLLRVTNNHLLYFTWARYYPTVVSFASYSSKLTTVACSWITEYCCF